MFRDGYLSTNNRKIVMFPVAFLMMMQQEARKLFLRRRSKTTGYTSTRFVPGMEGAYLPPPSNLYVCLYRTQVPYHGLKYISNFNEGAIITP